MFYALFPYSKKSRKRTKNASQRPTSVSLQSVASQESVSNQLGF